ncbi:hypothetical protein U1Q18_011734 [Sarracenia purpurea var. burkii]
MYPNNGSFYGDEDRKKGLDHRTRLRHPSHHRRHVLSPPVAQMVTWSRTPGMRFVIATQTLTPFPVVSRLLIDLHVMNSELGHLALASALVRKLVSGAITTFMTYVRVGFMGPFWIKIQAVLLFQDDKLKNPGSLTISPKSSGSALIFPCGGIGGRAFQTPTRKHNLLGVPVGIPNPFPIINGLLFRQILGGASAQLMIPTRGQMTRSVESEIPTSSQDDPKTYRDDPETCQDDPTPARMTPRPARMIRDLPK